jgi:hypothetical protein
MMSECYELYRIKKSTEPNFTAQLNKYRQIFADRKYRGGHHNIQKTISIVFLII